MAKTVQWEKVVALLEEQNGRSALLSVLSILLTSEERSAIGDRLAIMQALLLGQESQREISARLGVSIAKITRCSNTLKLMNDQEKQVIQG